jgi:hypothetical protein
LIPIHCSIFVAQYILNVLALDATKHVQQVAYFLKKIDKMSIFIKFT